MVNSHCLGERVEARFETGSTSKLQSCGMGGRRDWQVNSLERNRGIKSAFQSHASGF